MAIKQKRLNRKFSWKVLSFEARVFNHYVWVFYAASTFPFAKIIFLLKHLRVSTDGNTLDFLHFSKTFHKRRVYPLKHQIIGFNTFCVRISAWRSRAGRKRIWYVALCVSKGFADENFSLIHSKLKRLSVMHGLSLFSPFCKNPSCKEWKIFFPLFRTYFVERHRYVRRNHLRHRKSDAGKVDGERLAISAAVKGLKRLHSPHNN